MRSSLYRRLDAAADRAAEGMNAGSSRAFFACCFLELALMLVPRRRLELRPIVQALAIAAGVVAAAAAMVAIWVFV